MRALRLMVPGRVVEDQELDLRVLASAQAGADDAWAALVEQYQRRVFALLSRMLGPYGLRPQVEDLAQETFLRVFRGLGGFSAAGPARLSTWILTIATRVALDELRRPWRKLAQVVELEPAAEPAPDRQLERRALGLAIERAAAALPPEHLAALLLREVHGLSLAETAEALGVEVGTVKSRVSRAKAALRAALAEFRP